MLDLKHWTFDDLLALENILLHADTFSAGRTKAERGYAATVRRKAYQWAKSVRIVRELKQKELGLVVPG